MKKVGLLLLALAMVTGMSLATSKATISKSFEKDGNPYSTKVFPASKDQADSVLADVHDYTAYITAVRAIDYEPTSGAAFVIFRSTNGQVYFLGSLDQGANYVRQGPLVAGGIRYPSAMTHVEWQLPFAFYNRGWGAADEGAAVIWDDLGIAGGLWSSELFLSTIGRGVSGSAIYVVNGVKGTNGRIHALSNYWGDNTPEASLYNYSDDGGYTWSTEQLMFYSMQGTEDSIALFAPGPVVHDPVWSGYIAQNLLFCSATGETLMIGACGKEDTAEALHAALMKYWYRISYDNGATWTPFTYAPHAGQEVWVDNGCYDFGIALDKEGYPHFIGLLLMDTTDGGWWGPNVGLYDYHQTSSGWVKTLIHASNDSLGDVMPAFVNAGRDAHGDLVISYQDGTQDDTNNDIWMAWTRDNGATYSKKKVTWDAGGYNYVHIPMNLPDSNTVFPIWYQRGNTGFISWQSVTGVAGEPAQPTRKSFTLMQNFPNPVVNRTDIMWNQSKAGKYSLCVYNVAGQMVKKFEGMGQVGENSVTWNVGNVRNGVYFYKLTSGEGNATKKMVVVK